MNFSVTKHCQPLDPCFYTWDEKTKTFSIYEENVVLDFSGIDNITFKTGNSCSFKTGDSCTFDTGSNCLFIAGNNCKFDTDCHCNFNTGKNCIFTTNSYCYFKSGDDCVFKVIPNVVFEIGENCYISTWNKRYDIEPNRKLVLIENHIFKEILGHIPTKIYSIVWWKEDNKIMIQVGCQKHSLEIWKTHYDQIANIYHFDKSLIPEFLNHLKTIEETA